MEMKSPRKKEKRKKKERKRKKERKKIFGVSEFFDL